MSPPQDGDWDTIEEEKGTTTKSEQSQTLAAVPLCPPTDAVPAEPRNQLVLEAKLMAIAEIKLGVLNAVHIMERALLEHNRPEGDLGDEQPPSRPYQLICFVNPNANTPASRWDIYSRERSGSTAAVRDIGYSLGLADAIHLLQKAVEDRERVNVGYTIKWSKIL